MLIPVGTSDTLPTETFNDLGELVPQELDAVTVIVPLAPVVPVVTVIDTVPCPVSMFHPAGNVHV